MESTGNVSLDAYIDANYIDKDGYLKWYCMEYGITTPTELIEFADNHHREWLNITRSVRKILR